MYKSFQNYFTECYTVSGPGANKPCIFPFRFNGVSYNTCTLDSAEENKPWCSTLVDENNNHVPGGGHYGDCGPKCPLPDIASKELYQSSRYFGINFHH